VKRKSVELVSSEAERFGKKKNAQGAVDRIVAGQEERGQKNGTKRERAEKKNGYFFLGNRPGRGKRNIGKGKKRGFRRANRRRCVKGREWRN